MIVGVVAAEVVDCRSVAEVRVVHDAASLEFVESAIHGCFVDIRVFNLDRSSQLLGCEVIVGEVENGFDNGSPRTGDAKSFASHP